MTSWNEVVESARSRHGDEVVDAALQYTAECISRLSPEQRDLLESHGYASQAAPRGVSGGPDMLFFSYFTRLPSVFLRNRVCKLAGVVIEGHETSDLDNELRCIHCGYEGSDEWF